jgi:hypothetical protein
MGRGGCWLPNNRKICFSDYRILVNYRNDPNNHQIKKGDVYIKQCVCYTNLQPLFKTSDMAKSLGYIHEIGNRNKSNKICNFLDK